MGDVTATLLYPPHIIIYYKDFATTLQIITEYPSGILEYGI